MFVPQLDVVVGFGVGLPSSDEKLRANRISREMSPLATSCSGSERETVRVCTDIERCTRYHGYTKLESPEIVLFLKTFYADCGFRKTVRSAGRRLGGILLLVQAIRPNDLGGVESAAEQRCTY